VSPINAIRVRCSCVGLPTAPALLQIAGEECPAGESLRAVDPCDNPELPDRSIRERRRGDAGERLHVDAAERGVGDADPALYEGEDRGPVRDLESDPALQSTLLHHLVEQLACPPSAGQVDDELVDQVLRVDVARAGQPMI